jgi:hypothetical protein
VRDEIGEAEYVRLCKTNDERTAAAKDKRTELVKRLPTLHSKATVMQGVRRYCDAVSSNILPAQNEEVSRRALVEHIDKIVFEKGAVSILGTIAIGQSGDDADKVGYRTNGRIERPFVSYKVRIPPRPSNHKGSAESHEYNGDQHDGDPEHDKCNPCH